MPFHLYEFTLIVKKIRKQKIILITKWNARINKKFILIRKNICKMNKILRNAFFFYCDLEKKKKQNDFPNIFLNYKEKN